ncbi:hypothetical protein A9Q99_10065 [Gammaproteobacteria bacterium 45_16_T64]|nr:hypothetical protein A9Q99_10065 [Gammaproteobacteria bacterium 45_16_T64]
MAEVSQPISHVYLSIPLSIVIGILLCVESFASEALFDDYYYDESYADISLSLGTGTREAELRWSIASDSSGRNTPNILSELTYENLTITELQGSVHLHFNQGFLKKFDINIDIKSGKNRDGLVIDSDYNGNNRTDEYSRSESNPDGSTTLDGKIVIGYPLQWNERFFVTPFVGYNYSQQYLRMRNGVQIIDTRAASLPIGPFTSELNSKYEAVWNSAIFAFDATYRGENHHLGLLWEFLITDYYAEANWNLRSDFDHPKSFAHWATGTGNNLEFKYQYFASPRFSLWVTYRIEDWKTNKGDDVVYFSDGTKAGTQLNEVVWESTATSAGFSLHF